jgi:hypothetical protein
MATLPTVISKTLLTLIFLPFFYICNSQGKRIKAVKTGHSIKIDGDINDPGWNSIEPVSDFITSTPVY